MTNSKQIDVSADFPFFETLRWHRFGPSDPTARCVDGVFEKAVWTPQGAGVLRLVHESGRVTATGLGEGGALLVDWSERVLGLGDDLGDFHPGKLAERCRRWPTLRLSRAPWLSQTLITLVLQQRVAWDEAANSYRRLVMGYGESAPEGASVLLPPSPKTLKGLGGGEFGSLGVERKRASVVQELGWVGSRLDKKVTLPREELRRLLLGLRGVGPWTCDFTLGFCLGWPDVVPLGDYDLPNSVAFALAGEERADDQRMLELLEPYRPHRFRVIRLIMDAGIQSPRRGPKLARSQALGHRRRRRST